MLEETPFLTQREVGFCVFIGTDQMRLHGNNSYVQNSNE
jgi:hypothetical protein